MKRIRQLPGESGDYVFTAAVPASRSIDDYTARLIPYYEGVKIPLENTHILWQR
jgi:glycogen phosphorylase